VCRGKVHPLPRIESGKLQVKIVAKPTKGSRHEELTLNLFSRETMSIPKGWLCYLAPEIMRSLTVYQSEGDDLPFTKASDIFAFGTVWFEMLTGEWPWKTIGPESIIWLVGRGMKPSLANLQASRDVKDILVMCWTYNADHRPDFIHMSKMLEKIPKKRLAR
jgi:kinase suppressor of Ras 2